MDGRGGSRGRKRGLCRTLEAEVRREIDDLIGGGPVDALDFEAVELAVRRKALQREAQALAARINADTSDHARPTCPCPRCHGPARYRGRRDKTIDSSLGPMTLSRAWYHCDACRAGFAPRDRALGLDRRGFSPAATRMIAAAGATVGFEEGHGLLKELADLDVAPKTIERISEQVGAAVAHDEQAVVEAPADGKTVDTMYLAVDGTGAPMRPEELIGREGKQQDGRAKTREVKLAVVFTAQGRDKHGRPCRDEGSVSYSAGFESAADKDTVSDVSPFARRVQREAERRGFDRAKRQVCLGDGAAWIWNLFALLFPHAIPILDLFHAKEHLGEVAAAIYGKGTDLARAAREMWGKLLEAGKLDELYAVLRSREKAAKEVEACIAYFERNRERMDYPRYRTLGLCVGSGVVEAGCDLVVGRRLKRPGMRWTEPGAAGIIALRCCRLSGRFEDYWERRAENPPQAPTGT